MSFGFLGSICPCDGAFFSLGCNVKRWICCDCSEKTIVIGDNSEAAKKIIEISRTCPTLHIALDKAEWSDESPELKKRKVSSYGQHHRIEGKAAILNITMNSLSSLASPELNVSRAEKMARLQMAAFLSDISDISVKYEQEDPFTEKEYKYLRLHVLRIRRYGSSAAFLFEQLRHIDTHHIGSGLIALRDHNIINNDQRITLTRMFIKYKNPFLNKNSFSELDFEVKVFLLEAAEYFSLKEKDAHRTFLWTADSPLSLTLTPDSGPSIGPSPAPFPFGHLDLDSPKSNGSNPDSLKSENPSLHSLKLDGPSPENILEEAA